MIWWTKGRVKWLFILFDPCSSLLFLPGSLLIGWRLVFGVSSGLVRLKHLVSNPEACCTKPGWDMPVILTDFIFQSAALKQSRSCCHGDVYRPASMRISVLSDVKVCVPGCTRILHRLNVLPRYQLERWFSVEDSCCVWIVKFMLSN